MNTHYREAELGAQRQGYSLCLILSINNCRIWGFIARVLSEVRHEEPTAYVLPSRALLMYQGSASILSFLVAPQRCFCGFKNRKQTGPRSVLPAQLSPWGCGKTALAAELIPLLAHSFHRLQHITNNMEILQTRYSKFFASVVE